jgi:hypothetical protein
MKPFPIGIPNFILHRNILLPIFVVVLGAVAICAAQSKTPAPSPAPDVLVLSNGDTLHGKFVSETAGKVSFHSDPLGDLEVSWDNVKELHVSEKFGVLSSAVKPHNRKKTVQIPEGTLDVADQAITLHPVNGEPPPPIPVKSAQFIMDSATLDKEINHEPNFFAAWNGAATAGATLVSATDNQYTFTGGVSLVRQVPAASWLDPRNKTLFEFTESYGKITQPAYSYAPTPHAPVLIEVPSEVTKSSILHFGAERDQYVSSRIYALGQAAFDHNYGQDLQLQQIYGGGFGWTVVQSPKHEFDLRGTVQYEKQQFTPDSGSVNQNLIGSTFSASYLLHLKLLSLTQTLSFIPAYNELNAYSATETNMITFPTFKRLGFSAGTIDTYLNDAPFIGTASNPPTKPNSFQFTMGVTYAIKSKY